MKTVCEINKCAGCMLCKDVCPKGAIRILDNIVAYNAVIDQSVCINCGKCYRICQVNNPVQVAKPISWLQGWAKDESIRNTGASGGVATAIEKSFVRQGGIIYSCAQQKDRFVFKAANKEDEITSFSGSKYVKSTPEGIYKEIRAQLNEERNILFVGLPCQVAALKNLVGERENLYTIDLICHGTPSPLLLRKFLGEAKIEVSDNAVISFRKGNSFSLSVNGKRISRSKVRDYYTESFLKGLSYTENCYSCQFAKTERCSDLTLGDSWKSDLPMEEKEKGISLLLCQTEKGRELIDSSNLFLTEVDIKKAIEGNGQLQKPMKKTEEREIFISAMQKGADYSTAIKKCWRKKYYKDSVKNALAALGISKFK